jgi:diguanylate cyclase (GGDEF)-like protein/PAS domain S-box-containing protein
VREVDVTSTPENPDTGGRTGPVPDESVRVAALRAHRILDTAPEHAFDDLVRLAAELSATPVAMINLIDADRQWTKSAVGIDICAVDRALSFCSHALDRTDPLVVEDTRLDARFAANPFVIGDPHVRFYAGAPLRSADGYALGTLCVVGFVARTLTERQVRQLLVLGRQVSAQLALRRQALEFADSQRLLQGVLDHTDALVSCKDLDGRYTLANRALHDLVGRPCGSIVGLSTADVFTADLAARFDRDDRSVAAHGRRLVVAERVVDASGVSRDLRSTKFALRDDTGRVYAIAGVSTDVTDLAHQRRMLAESERRWRALVERSPVAVAVIQIGGCFAYANPRAVELYGAAGLDDIIGRDSMEFVPTGAERATIDLFSSVLGGVDVTGARWQLRRLDGRLVDVEINAAAVDYRGQPAVQVELRDMTAQVAAEAALRESERRWRAVFDGSPVGIGVADPDGILLSANAALCELLGRACDDVVGRPIRSFVHPDDRGPRGSADALPPPGEDGVVTLERRYLRPDGEVRWGWVTSGRIPGPAGEAWSLVHVQDITARRADEEVVSRSEANLAAVSEVARQIQSGSDARQTICEAARTLAGALSVSLAEPHTDRPVLVITSSSDPDLVGTVVHLSDTSVLAEVYRRDVALFVPDAVAEPLASPALIELSGVRSLYVVPVRAADEVTAVLVVGWGRRVSDLDDGRAGVVTLLADQAGAALRQAGLIAALESMAVTDPLTTLPNRRGWEALVHRELVDAAETGRPLTVALADLDHFKRYNDTFGHAAGDEFLRQFAASVGGALRSRDAVVRWGGEEFAFALPDCAPAEAVRVLTRVRRAVPLRQTCSIGHATWDGVEDADSLMARADRALYVAKRAGRDRVVGAA